MLRTSCCVLAGALLFIGCGSDDSGTPGNGGVAAPTQPTIFDTPPPSTGQDPTAMPAAPVAVQPPATTVEPPVTTDPAPGTAGTEAPQVPEPSVDAEGCELAMNECGLDTGWPGDEYCILPPPPGEGFQVHIGPDNYDNPGSRWLVPVGVDTNDIFTATSTNDSTQHYFYRQYRMRPGSHHMILSEAGGIAGGRRIASSSNAAKDNPECAKIAPENEGLGMRIAPNTPLSMSLHYFNLTDAPVLKEVWVNFWYRDPAEVKEEATSVFALGGLAMSIAPGSHTTLGPYSCGVNRAGRILSLNGHYHANTVRFSAWRVRGGQRELILEDYDWHDPIILEYNSLVENPVVNAPASIPGGWSGILDLEPRDTVEWECEVENDTDQVLRFSNEAVSGEMCILVGEAVGETIGCMLP